MKIVRKMILSTDPSPMFKKQLQTAREKERMRVLNNLLGANAKLKKERCDAAINDIRRIIDMTGKSISKRSI